MAASGNGKVYPPREGCLRNSIFAAWVVPGLRGLEQHSTLVNTPISIRTPCGSTLSPKNNPHQLETALVVNGTHDGPA